MWFEGLQLLMSMNGPSPTPGDCKACFGEQRSTTAGLRRILPAFFRWQPSSWKKSPGSSIFYYLAPTMWLLLWCAENSFNWIWACTRKSKTHSAQENVSTECPPKEHDDPIPQPGHLRPGQLDALQALLAGSLLALLGIQIPSSERRACTQPSYI